MLKIIETTGGAIIRSPKGDLFIPELIGGKATAPGVIVTNIAETLRAGGAQVETEYKSTHLPRRRA